MTKASQTQFQESQTLNTPEDKLENDKTVVELSLNQDTPLNKETDELLSIKEAVSKNLEQYFINLGHQEPSQLHQLVLNEVEPALLNAVLDYTHGNQSKAAEVLGLNRGTLRKKIKQYNIE